MSLLDRNTDPEFLHRIVQERHRRLLQEAEAERALRAAEMRPHSDQGPAARLLGFIGRVVHRRAADA